MCVYIHMYMYDLDQIERHPDDWEYLQRFIESSAAAAGKGKYPADKGVADKWLTSAVEFVQKQQENGGNARGGENLEQKIAKAKLIRGPFLVARMSIRSSSTSLCEMSNQWMW